MSDDWRDKLAKNYPSSAKITALDPKGFVRAQQVKEKFGGLRFYYRINIDDADQAEALYKKIHKLVEEAEAKSYETCEKCGKPGSTEHPKKDQFSWIEVLCDDCAEKEANNES